ncbi:MULTISPECIES: aldehyde dehydrogenase family protein [Rhodococcus]|uniref:aldehyde dehydrogenase family protein n=1 Tax=Rhodococcus TaxID=1827 RepID=UPI00031E5E67|nr:MULTISPECIES: aldehyde dehydrogenase family protein [Rhodococcus]AWZ23523.1 aldehyde dehydrogenase [Rhodococcus pyridinivorans]KHJ71339.1 aldehyde dehydrogenase [Rhodococcus sp. Chr-9]MCW3472380.1 aldehyde dehydrogenase family protein [Rhodococcus pyridinivorans]QXU54031.1 aldehyde dehydrogenase family protein [Rhodococcus sp. LW-XY12]SEB65517.1 aldehyde dehydrogenase (NAD+) [Rhodococcus pyridinivorans]
MTITGLNHIDGNWVPAASGAVFERRNPADETDLIGTFPDSDAIDVRNAVDALDKAAPEWAAAPPERRAAILEAAADHLAAHSAELVDELIREEGKTRAEASMEVTRTPMNLRFYAGEALRATGATFPAPGSTTIYTVREPIGIVGAITPWNFPLNIPSRKLGPALAAGNTVLFKPSEITPLMGQRLVEALLAGGLPPGAIALVQGDGKAGAAVSGDERVAAVTFTGSTEVGRAIHRSVGPDRRVQLEMGGKNPVVVLADADLDAAAALIVKGAFGLSGQACTGTSRVVAVDAIHDELLEKVAERTLALRVGPGSGAAVDVGPLAGRGQLDKFLEYVTIGTDEGARLVCGGVRCEDDALRDGFFVRPTVFADTAPGMRLLTDEIFGPVLAFQRAGSFDEALALANDTAFGLSASVVTRSLSAAQRFIAGSRTGLVKVNQPTTGMAMNAPFGGYKQSSTQTFKEQAGPTLMQFYQSEKTVYLSPDA